MANHHWPLFDLRITTPRLELRYPTDHDLFALAGILAEGIHDPEAMPFTDPWTRAESPDLERNALRFWWSRRAALVPDDWALPFAVFESGDVVGVQDIYAKHFATTRTVTTGSWLVQRAHGHGLGKEMRAAVLHLAFAELGAVEAYTDAFADNPASLGVTRALGYEQNGTHLHEREGASVRVLEFVLTRTKWEAHGRDDIQIVGLPDCRSLLGA
jgi:RimJ/RimL family protein N-acetyltransferase